MIGREEQAFWHVKQLEACEYERAVPDRRVFFNEPRFTELNRGKADDVCYLLILRGESPRFGVIVGRVGSEARVPFSAPYSYPVPLVADSRQEAIDAALWALEGYLSLAAFMLSACPASS